MATKASKSRTALAETEKGAFVRKDSVYRDWIEEGGKFPPEGVSCLLDMHVDLHAESSSQVLAHDDAHACDASWHTCRAAGRYSLYISYACPVSLLLYHSFRVSRGTIIRLLLVASGAVNMTSDRTHCIAYFHLQWANRCLAVRNLKARFISPSTSQHVQNLCVSTRCRMIWCSPSPPGHEVLALVTAGAAGCD